MADYFKIKDFATVTKTILVNPVESNPNYDISNDFKAFDKFILYAWVKKAARISETNLDVITVDSMMLTSKLDFEFVYSILHDEVFPMLGLDFKDKKSKNGQYTQEYVQYSQYL